MNGWSRRDDRSEYALMNEITAAARDERDPAIRWSLEEFGGSICSRSRERRAAADSARTGRNALRR